MNLLPMLCHLFVEDLVVVGVGGVGAGARPPEQHPAVLHPHGAQLTDRRRQHRRALLVAGEHGGQVVAAPAHGDTV